MTGFDAVLLSYDEPMANSLHSRLQRTLGGTVKRLHGVHGMRRAYRLCAEVVDREQFFLADGDFAIDTGFDPATVEPLDDGVSMRVWRAVNPVNGLTYGARDPQRFDHLNDPTWLRERFTAAHGDQAVSG
ncbi:hypothetical protein ACPCSC_31485 [Streptomyces lavendulocolor]|uniref:hypothetical protein n=1 Tax=Streptomyces lavendulocolor TaxID=67316 RepID=UPI003C2BCED2